MTALHKNRRPAREAFCPESSDRWDCVGFLLLTALAVASPWLYAIDAAWRGRAIGTGASRPGVNLMFELAAFVLATVTCLSRSRSRAADPPTVPLGAMIALVLLGLIQLLPLPEGVLDRIGPVNLQIYHQSDELLRLFGRRAAVSPRVSLAPGETFGAVLLIIAYLALFLSATSLLRMRQRRRLLTGAFIAAAVVHTVYALIRESPTGPIRGAFETPQDFAAYLEIALALAFGIVWAEVLTNSERGENAADRGERFERRFVPLAGRILVWAVIAAAVGLTRSPEAMLSAGVTTAVLLAIAVLHRRVRFPARAAASVTLSLLAAVLLAAALTGRRPFGRFLENDLAGPGLNAQPARWKTTLQAWREFPLVGSGLGTFREAFRRVQPREIPGVIEHARSDSLQLLVTGGAAGAILGVLAGISMLWLLFSSWRKQEHREESALTLGGFGALFSLALHGLVASNLSSPATAAMLSCALAVGWAAGKAR